MEYDFTHEPSYTMVTASLDRGDEITVEGGSMVSYTGGVEMETHSSSGGLLSSVKDSVLSGEETFRNTFRATSNDQTVEFAHTQPGDMKALKLNDEAVRIQSGSYVANSPGIETESVSGGMDSLLGGKGLFFLRAKERATSSLGATEVSSKRISVRENR